ncbi:MAG TPA: heme biosynthesis protein HemY, partial [Xanthobacteraceae bacterium]
ERLDRMDKLDRLSAGHIDGALALARAAIDAHAFARARAALEPFLAAPTRRVALIMAELEEAESGDIGRAREWVARALRAAPDPAWTADGFVSETWMPVSPTGRLDGFEWKVPLAELPSPLIEPQRATEPSAAPAPPESLVPPPAAPAQEVAAEAATETEAAAPVAARPVATVIPIHAPDDPGTEPVPESEPVPEAKRRWRLLFG